MVQIVQKEATLRLLVERLLWPSRMVRWRVAQEYGALLADNDTKELALAVLLNWIEHRSLESEAVSALSILKCVPDSVLPPKNTICGAINAPSILADLIIRQVYGFGNLCGGWSNAHMGTAPASFEVPDYFLRNERGHVPPILGNNMERLGKISGYDFHKQWAFEWQSLMDRFHLHYSDYPYYFIDTTYRDNGVSGQFSLRQDDVFRSAYLRTIAFGVSKGMPMDFAYSVAADTLTLNSDFANIRPVSRPAWLSDLPERCVANGANIESLGREMCAAGLQATGNYPVSLKTPVAIETAKFADLELTAVMASDNFTSASPDLDHLSRKFWKLGDTSSFNCVLSANEISDCLLMGDSGDCVPYTMSVWPDSLGFWHNDYYQTGIALPLSFVLPAQANAVCGVNGIDIHVQGRIPSRWSVWHDSFSSIYALGGTPRCGMLTEMNPQAVAVAAKRHDRKLGWIIRVRHWKSDKDYSPLELFGETKFYFD